MQGQHLKTGHSMSRNLVASSIYGMADDTLPYPDTIGHIVARLRQCFLATSCHLVWVHKCCVGRCFSLVFVHFFVPFRWLTHLKKLRPDLPTAGHPKPRRTFTLSVFGGLWAGAKCKRSFFFIAQSLCKPDTLSTENGKPLGPLALAFRCVLMAENWQG